MAKSEPTVQELFDLSGRVALITGGTGFLGTAMSRALAEAGATVVISSRDRKRAQAAADALPKAGKAGQAHVGVELDHMTEKSIAAGVKETLEKAGRIDILVNNGLEIIGKDWTTCTFDEFARQQVNNAGYFVLAREVRNHVVGRKGAGSIINIGSMYGQVGSYPDAYEGVCTASPVFYHALKGGTIHMTRHLACYWAKDNIRVNCLSPGPFPNADDSGELIKRLKTKLPMRRMGKPNELKGAIVFLASDASSFMTGQNVTIDGGWTAW